MTDSVPPMPPGPPRMPPPPPSAMTPPSDDVGGRWPGGSLPFSRIAGNLQKMGREPITWKPGLAIVVWLLGGCTLSIINFFMLREYWRGSDPDVAAHDGRWRTGAISPRIVAWFVLGIAQIAVGAVAGLRWLGGVNLGSGTNAFAESLPDRLLFVMASSIGAIVSSLLLVLIVRELTTRHMQATREV